MRKELITSEIVKSTIEIEKVVEKHSYIAWDGVEFDEQSKCTKYEKEKYTAKKYECCIVGTDFVYYKIKNQYELHEFLDKGINVEKFSKEIYSYRGDFDFPIYVRSWEKEIYYYDCDSVYRCCYKMVSMEEYESFEEYEEFNIDDLIDVLKL